MKEVTKQELLEIYSAYLPYGVNVYHFENKRQYPLVVYNPSVSMRSGLNINECINEGCKLILNPRSDLTKEIEHEGERFVPIDYFIGGDDDLVLNALIYHKDYSYLPYNLIKKLLSCRFDIFNAIDRGVAVDINTINK